jgi:hypothetical protein
VKVTLLRLATPRTAIIVGAVEALLTVAAVVLFFLTPASQLLGLIQSLVIWLALAAVGVVVAQRQPRNPIGWLLLGAGIGLTLATAGGAYAELVYRQAYSDLPFARAALILESSWTLTVALMPLTILLFPDGRLPSSRWRWALWPYLAVNAFWTVGVFALSADAVLRTNFRVDSDGSLVLVDHPSGSWAWFGTAEEFLTPVLVIFWLAFLLQLVARLRHASGARRAQLKWLISGAAVCIACGALGVIGSAFDASPSPAMNAVQTIVTFGVAALPLSIGVGILRYRLYDIDRLVSRTLSYAILTGLLVAVYFCVVTLATRALPLSSPVGVAASTLAAAALFHPLRTRVQRLVDRRFNRAHYDAEATTAAFAGHLRDAVDLGAVQIRLIETVTRSLEPSHASLWIRPRAAARDAQPPA